MSERTYEANTRATPPYIGSEAWETSEWEMPGRTSDERREERDRALREVICAVAARRESEAMRKESRGEAKCARREEREAQEGRLQRRGERRAARAGTARRRAVRSGRKKETRGGE